ncbi:hypothetical protein M514_01593, partial [Trichuris suis]
MNEMRTAAFLLALLAVSNGSYQTIHNTVANGVGLRPTMQRVGSHQTIQNTVANGVGLQPTMKRVSSAPAIVSMHRDTSASRSALEREEAVSFILKAIDDYGDNFVTTPKNLQFLKKLVRLKG